MRTFITFLAALIMCGLVPSPGHAAAPDGLRLVAVGDSLAAGSGSRDPATQSWPARIGATNLAEGGSCLVTQGCMYPVPLLESITDALALKPDLVLVSIGRNDLCHMPTRQLINAYRELRAVVHAAGVGIRFATITPAGQAWPWPCEQQRIEVNTWLRTLDGTMDFEAVTITPRGLLRKRFDYDGLHMNAAGYRRVAKIARDAVYNRG